MRTSKTDAGCVDFHEQPLGDTRTYTSGPIPRVSTSIAFSLAYFLRAFYVRAHASPRRTAHIMRSDVRRDIFSGRCTCGSRRDIRR
jgi:hypothetical protein